MECPDSPPGACLAYQRRGGVEPGPCRVRVPQGTQAPCAEVNHLHACFDIGIPFGCPFQQQLHMGFGPSKQISRHAQFNHLHACLHIGIPFGCPFQQSCTSDIWPTKQLKQACTGDLESIPGSLVIKEHMCSDGGVCNNST